MPGVADPAGALAPGPALDAVPHLAEQEGPIRLRIARLAGLDGWTPSVTALRPAREPDEVPGRGACPLAARESAWPPDGSRLRRSLGT